MKILRNFSTWKTHRQNRLLIVLLLQSCFLLLLFLFDFSFFFLNFTTFIESRRRQRRVPYLSIWSRRKLTRALKWMTITCLQGQEASRGCGDLSVQDIETRFDSFISFLFFLRKLPRNVFFTSLWSIIYPIDYNMSTYRSNDQFCLLYDQF